MRFFLRMNIYRAVKFSLYHVAEVPPIKCRFPGTGFAGVPGERAESTRVSFTITPARPGRYVTALGVIVPDEGPAIFRGLISSLAARDIHQHEQRSANKEQSPGHLGTQYSR